MPSLTRNAQTQRRRWHRYGDAATLEHAAVTTIMRAAEQAIKARAAFHIVLAGGTTPRRVYEALRHIPTDWSAWHVYFGDERCLPQDHPERNSRMAASAWLEHVGIPSEQIHIIPAELGAQLAAASYVATLDTVVDFDLVLLGLGEDGHTASLFPGHDAGTAPNAPAALAVTDAPKPPPQRVSLSARRLSAAHQVMFLVAGNGKLEAVKDWQSGLAIPAAQITPECGVDIYIEAALLA